jgi:hypothetical protein
MLVHENPDFGALPADLAALFKAAGETSFYAQAAWFDLLARYASDPENAIRLYSNEARPTVAMVCRTSKSQMLEGLANFYTLEYAPIIAPDVPTGHVAVRGLLEKIAAERPNWSTLRFNALDPDTPNYAAMLAGLRDSGLIAQPYFDSGTWFEATSGLDFKHYLEARPAQLRNTFRRKEKSGRNEGVSYEFNKQGRSLESLIADYETVYANSWKKGEPYPDFMRKLMLMAAAQGALRLGVARVDKTPAAAQFWLLWCNRATIYKLAHDERYAQLSLGTVLTMHMMERVLDEDRPVEINFGRGDDPYKKSWLGQRRERWGLFAANPRTWRGARLGIRVMASRIRDRLLPLPRP